jgi:hypothetical protein
MWPKLFLDFDWLEWRVPLHHLFFAANFTYEAE